VALAKGPLDPNAKNEAGVAALYAAVVDEDEAVVRALLERGAKVNGEKGPMDIPQVPLCAAASQNNPVLLRLLLDKGADPRIQGDLPRSSALHLAARAGKRQNVELLLKHLPVDVKDEEGCTPLQVTLDGDGDIGPVFKCLLEAGADPKVTVEGVPLVWFALRGKHYPEAQWLLDGMTPEVRRDFLIHPFDEQRTALAWAAFTGRTEAVTMLLKVGSDPNARDRFEATPLNLVVRKGYTDTVAALLAGKADPEIPDKEGFRPLYWATAHGFTDIVRLLLDAKADRTHTNPQGLPLLHTAARLGRPEALGLLLERGEALECRDPFGATPFLRAIEQSKLDCAKRLLARGADPKAVMPDGSNALMLLSECLGHRIDLDAEPSEPMQALALLLSQKLDPAARDAEGQTALHRAVANHDLPFIQALAQAGCPVKALDAKGRSALHAALSDRSVKLPVIRWLMAQGLDLNQPDQEGWTPLQLFAQCAVVGTDEWPCLIQLGGDLSRTLPTGQSLVHVASPHLVEDLLARGADVNARDKKGCTRLMLAAEKSEAYEVEDLLALGAEPTLKDAAGRTALDHLKLGQETGRQAAAKQESPNARHDLFRERDGQKVEALLKDPAQVEQREPKKLETPPMEEEMPPPPPPAKRPSKK